jgi:hypothetical protein
MRPALFLSARSILVTMARRCSLAVNTTAGEEKAASGLSQSLEHKKVVSSGYKFLLGS